MAFGTCPQVASVIWREPGWPSTVGPASDHDGLDISCRWYFTAYTPSDINPSFRIRSQRARARISISARVRPPCGDPSPDCGSPSGGPAWATCPSSLPYPHPSSLILSQSARCKDHAGAGQFPRPTQSPPLSFFFKLKRRCAEAASPGSLFLGRPGRARGALRGPTQAVRAGL